MRNMCVTTTGIDKEDKTEIQRKIERMAGIYSNSFHEGVTHLVAEVERNDQFPYKLYMIMP